MELFSDLDTKQIQAVAPHGHPQLTVIGEPSMAVMRAETALREVVASKMIRVEIDAERTAGDLAQGGDPKSTGRGGIRGKLDD